MTLEDAVRKMTSLSADRFHLTDRGRLQEGFWADITVFDPDSVWDHTTYLEPDLKPSGIEYVIVNGVVIVDRGTVDTGTLAGKVVRAQGA
jgi:N-acyl-D-aspartate/D-glutamate deacylase